MDDEIRKWIESCKQAGYSEEQIKEALKNRGYDYSNVVASPKPIRILPFIIVLVMLVLGTVAYVVMRSLPQTQEIESTPVAKKLISFRKEDSLGYTTLLNMSIPPLPEERSQYVFDMRPVFSNDGTKVAYIEWVNYTDGGEYVTKINEKETKCSAIHNQKLVFDSKNNVYCVTNHLAHLEFQGTVLVNDIPQELPLKPGSERERGEIITRISIGPNDEPVYWAAIYGYPLETALFIKGLRYSRDELGELLVTSLKFASDGSYAFVTQTGTVRDLKWHIHYSNGTSVVVEAPPIFSPDLNTYAYVQSTRVGYDSSYSVVFKGQHGSNFDEYPVPIFSDDGTMIAYAGTNTGRNHTNYLVISDGVTENKIYTGAMPTKITFVPGTHKVAYILRDRLYIDQNAVTPETTSRGNIILDYVFSKDGKHYAYYYVPDNNASAYARDGHEMSNHTISIDGKKNITVLGDVRMLSFNSEGTELRFGVSYNFTQILTGKVFVDN